nr:MAG: hypothetical protein [Microviridae sp.]
MMHYTDKWKSTVEYYDEEGTQICIKTNTEYKKYKKLHHEKYIEHETKTVIHRYVLQKSRIEQLELFK